MTDPTVVWWEDDPTKTRTVERWCRRCYPRGPVGEVWIVSPGGVAHVVEIDRTLCGKDATGTDWWWRM